MLDIILTLCLAVVTIVVAVALAASAWQWEQRARRAERIGYAMQQHLASLGCRVVVEPAECELVRFVWPEINDFVIDEQPERIVASEHAERTL